MNIDHDPSLIAAQRWYGIHRAEHLAHDCDRMIDRCATHLMSHMAIASATARQVAMQALAEIESGAVPGFIDIDRSNSRMVLLRNSSTGCTHLVTLPELFQLVESRNARDNSAQHRR